MTQFATYDDFETAKCACRDCAVGEIYNCVVPSEGNKSCPTVVIVGEAPGADEVEQKRPFIGRAGQVLREQLRRFNFTPHNTLITNTIPCRPLNNKYPDDKKLVWECTRKWLWKELTMLQPQFVLVLGGRALWTVMMLEGVTKCRGYWYTPANPELDSQCLATFHPSYVMRKQNLEDGADTVAKFESDLRQVAARAGFIQENG